MTSSIVPSSATCVCRGLSASALLAVAGWALGCTPRGVPAPPSVAGASHADSTAGPYRDSIPGTLVTFEMAPVPGVTVTVPARDGPRHAGTRWPGTAATLVTGLMRSGRTKVVRAWNEA